MAEKTLNLFAESYSDMGLQASRYAQAVNLFLRGPVRIEVIGARQDPVFQEFLEAASCLLEPRSVVLPLDVEDSYDRIRELHANHSQDTYARVCTDTLNSDALRKPSELTAKVSAVSKVK